MNGNSIASRVAVHRRYVRSVDVARDVDDPNALDGYVVTPSVRDAAIRILGGITGESRQRAYRVVGPYGIGKSAFGVFLAQLFQENGHGIATTLLRKATEEPIEITPWRPVILSGRHVSFSRELLRAISGFRDDWGSAFKQVKAKAASMMADDGLLDVHVVMTLVEETATLSRKETGRGLLFLIDEMGRFVEYVATHLGAEDPSIFQVLAERAGGRSGTDLAVIGFMHNRFVDYVAGLGGWVEADWSRSAERYEELSFDESIEQSLFMIAHAQTPLKKHTLAVQRQSTHVYGEAVDRGLFAAARQEIVGIAPNLYPLHPASVAVIVWAIRRYGQNERSLFSFLQSSEPAGLKRFSHFTRYDQTHWYIVPQAFDYLAATIGDTPGSDRTRRWSLAYDALAAAADLSQDSRNVLKTVALVAVLEPIPGLVANADTVAWCLGLEAEKAQYLLDSLAERNLIYRRMHRSDYNLWSSSSVELSRWLDEARERIPSPNRLEGLRSLVTRSRPAVAHRHYHTTGTLRTFELRLWVGDDIPERHADGLILVVPVYPGEDRETVIQDAALAVRDDPLALLCARMVTPDDLRWAHELALWNWIRNNCEELKVDELARVEVNERIASAEHALSQVTALLSSTTGNREEEWRMSGKPIVIPNGLSALLSDICDEVYDQAPILRNELINRTRLSTAVASARTRLLDRMLTNGDEEHLGIDGAPPERTIYLSLFHASGMHAKDRIQGRFVYGRPDSDDTHRWRPVWDRIDQQLDSENGVSVAALMQELARPPYGLRAAPALLVIVAIVISSPDSIAIMERNSFQPSLTKAHFMRLAKSPGNFTLRSLRRDPEWTNIVTSVATGLNSLGTCPTTVAGFLEKLYTWYNSLPSFALNTYGLSPIANAVRLALRKASEPEVLLFHDLPHACGAKAKDERIDVQQYVDSLDKALLELEKITPRLKSQAIDAAIDAFGVQDMDSLRTLIREDYGQHRMELADHRLRIFVERAMNTEFSDDRWLDGIAGHLTGQRLDNWEDDTLDKFKYEIRDVAKNLTKWLVLTNSPLQSAADLKSVHVVGVDGREQILIVRSDRPNDQLETRLNIVREALGDDPQAMEILAQLLAEYASEPAVQHEEQEVNPT